MKYVFISGIPAAGKSYLAEKISKDFGIKHFLVDDWRDEMTTNPELKKWVDFFWDKDEKDYWRTASCDQHWDNIKKQSEAFWPVILKKINEIEILGTGAVFEGVNILPHLAKKNFDFSGIFLLGDSPETIFERIKNDHRWGDTEELWKLETEAFWNCERLRYKEEAEKYGFKTFSNAELGEIELIKMLNS